MQKITSYIIAVISLLLFLVLTSCGKDYNAVDQSEPANLIIEVIYFEDNPKKVLIQARADNATHYELFIEDTDEPVASNTNGDFEHIFFQPGDYHIEVHAFGATNRYLKGTKTIRIGDADPVSIDQGYITPLEYEGYELVWYDEFNGLSLNANDWVFETGDGCPRLCGWGNNELQYYRRENAWVSDGTLIIEARNQPYQNREYTSARIKTQNKQSFQYGRIDIRALLPKGQGIWPALWMLGSDIQTVGWPKCGEIDIMELIGGAGRDNRVHGTLHWYNNGHVHTGRGYTLPSGIFADEYHVFSIRWDENKIKWYVNDVHFQTIDITLAHMTEFHKDYFFIFNIAVGGNWPGSPDETTVFNQQMKVDYVRVFQQY